MLFTHNLFNCEDFTKVAKFGVCRSNEEALFETSVSILLPIFLACFFTTILNIFLTIKAYQVYKQIQEESKLSGGHNKSNEHNKALKKKQTTIKKHLKPTITLLVVVLGTSSIGLLLPLFFIQAVFLTIYEGVMRYVVVYNLGYFCFLFHPFVYGLYFKQVREPMMRLLKSIVAHVNASQQLLLHSHKETE